MSRPIHSVLSVALLVAVATWNGGAAAQSAGRSCGTAWTGWVDEANPTRNPCPRDCVRGERLQDRQYKQGARIQYDVQYQCHFGDAGAAAAPAAAPTGTPAAPTGTPAPTAAAPSAAGAARGASALGSDDGLLFKGSPGVPGAPQGAFIDWDAPLSSGISPAPANATTRAWESTLRALAAIIRESPALSDLGGFYPRLGINFDPATQPVPSGALRVAAWPPTQVEPDPASPATAQRFRVKARQSGKDPGFFTLYVNRLPTEPKPLDWTNDDVFYALAPPQRHIAGFPVHENHLLITAPGKPPLFVPISRERAFRAQIGRWRGVIQDQGKAQGGVNDGLAFYTSAQGREMRRKMIDEAGARDKDPARAAAARRKAELDDAEQERQLRESAHATGSPAIAHAQRAIAELERRLGALSATERAAPAYMKIDPEAAVFKDVLVSADTPGAIPLVAYNERFFDPKLPPGTPQLITMTGWTRGQLAVDFDKQSVANRVYLAITEQTDWRRAAQLMK